MDGGVTDDRLFQLWLTCPWLKANLVNHLPIFIRYASN